MIIILKKSKISIFFLISKFITVNAIFFNDSTIHKIYEDNWSFNFIYQLPQIIYSTLISSIINKNVTFLSLREKNILSMKNKNPTNEAKEAFINRLIIKFILIFVLAYILLILL